MTYSYQLRLDVVDPSIAFPGGNVCDWMRFTNSKYVLFICTHMYVCT